MFVKVNDNCVVNIDQIVWIDTSAEHHVVFMKDGYEHVCSDNEKLHNALNIINNDARNNSIVK